MSNAGLRILMIDDDQKLASMLRDYLAPFGMSVEMAFTPDAGLTSLRADTPDLVLLDLMLPGKDGLTVCREIRAFSQIPIIMLTARGDTTDRVVGLEVGADDYVPKPFEPRELVARIQSVLRRSRSKPQPDETEHLVFEGLTVRASERDAVIGGKSIELSQAEFDLLWLLASHPGKKIDRDQIVQTLRGTDSDVFSRSVDVLISRVRSKLGDDPRDPHFIRTAWGTGYVFLGKKQGSA